MPPATTSVPAHRPSSGELALRSALIPGLGQFAQGRVGAGLWQLGTVLAYLAIAIASDTTHTAWLAAAWNVWSAVDVYISDRRSFDD